MGLPATDQLPSGPLSLRCCIISSSLYSCSLFSASCCFIKAEGKESTGRTRCDMCNNPRRCGSFLALSGRILAHAPTDWPHQPNTRTSVARLQLVVRTTFQWFVADVRISLCHDYFSVSFPNARWVALQANELKKSFQFLSSAIFLLFRF